MAAETQLREANLLLRGAIRLLAATIKRRKVLSVREREALRIARRAYLDSAALVAESK